MVSYERERVNELLNLVKKLSNNNSGYIPQMNECLPEEMTRQFTIDDEIAYLDSHYKNNYYREIPKNSIKSKILYLPRIIIRKCIAYLFFPFASDASTFNAHVTTVFRKLRDVNEEQQEELNLMKEQFEELCKINIELTEKWNEHMRR